jgi:hypothetical protein
MDYTYKKRSNLYGQGSPPAYSNSRFESAPNIFAPVPRAKKLNLISGHRQYPQHNSTSPPVNPNPASSEGEYSRGYQIYTPRPMNPQLSSNSNASQSPKKEQDWNSHQSQTSNSPNPLLHRFSERTSAQANPDFLQRKYSDIAIPKSSHMGHMAPNETSSIRSGGSGSGNGSGNGTGKIPKLNLYATTGPDALRANQRPGAYHGSSHYLMQASSTGRLVNQTSDRGSLPLKTETRGHNSTSNLLRKSDYDSVRNKVQSPGYNPL